MLHSDVINYNESVFESIRRINEYGQEFWYARELQKVLEYTDYRNFELVIYKAMDACKGSMLNIDDHFVSSTEMVIIGSNARRYLKSYMLSRYACYLIVQNSDPSKEIIALRQTYFAVQTRKQELFDNLAFADLSEDLPTPEKSIQQIEREQRRLKDE